MQPNQPPTSTPPVSSAAAPTQPVAVPVQITQPAPAPIVAPPTPVAHPAAAPSPVAPQATQALAKPNKLSQTVQEIILGELQLGELDPAMRQAMLDDIAETFYAYLVAECIQKLSDGDADQLEKLIDAGDEAASDQFLQEKLSDYPAIIERVSGRVLESIRGEQVAIDEALAA